MKIRTLLTQGAAIGVLAAGGLTLATGTAQAAINCNYTRSQISYYQTQVDWDLTMAAYWADLNDDANMEMWIDIAIDDQTTVNRLQRQFTAAHCA
jgi:hypothetical protein